MARLHADVGGGCFLHPLGGHGFDIVHTSLVSFYPHSFLVRLDSRLYVFPFPSRKSLLLPGSSSTTKSTLCQLLQYATCMMASSSWALNGLLYCIGYSLE